MSDTIYVNTAVSFEWRKDEIAERRSNIHFSSLTKYAWLNIYYIITSRHTQNEPYRPGVVVTIFLLYATTGYGSIYTCKH